MFFVDSWGGLWMVVEGRAPGQWYRLANGDTPDRRDIAEIGVRRILGLPPGCYGPVWDGAFAALASETDELGDGVDWVLSEATRLGPIRDEAAHAAAAAYDAATRRHNVLSGVVHPAYLTDADRALLEQVRPAWYRPAPNGGVK